jgi:hypothetical protein
MQKVEIRIKGGLDEHWSEWFQNFEVKRGEKDETILVGEVVDQAGLYGLIAKEDQKLALNLNRRASFRFNIALTGIEMTLFCPFS